MAREGASPLPKDVDSILNQEKNKAEDLPPLLQAHDDALTIICNKLDAKSFYRFSLASRRIYQFCRRAGNGVAINLKNEELEFYEDNGSNLFAYSSELVPLRIKSNDDRLSSFVSCLKSLPFRLHLRQLDFFSNRSILEVKEVLETFGAKTILRMVLDEEIVMQYGDLTSLIHEYAVKDVTILGEFPVQIYSPDEIRSLLLMPLWHLETGVLNEHSSLLPEVRIPSLVTYDGNVSPTHLYDIIEKFVSGDGLHQWMLTHSMTVGEWTAALAQYPQFHVDFMGVLPDQRPIAVYSFDQHHRPVYHILCHDGRIIRICNYGWCIIIKYCPLAEAPAILSRA